jgi:hypothetical protein
MPLLNMKIASVTLFLVFACFLSLAAHADYYKYIDS